MKYFAAMALATSFLAAASPVHQARQADESTTVVNNYLAAADATVSKLSIFGCDIIKCVEALGPLVASCAIAAATEGRDAAKDATCVGNAYQALSPSKKPAECNHCYK